MNRNCDTYLGNPAVAGGIGAIFSGVGNFISNSQELAWSAPECGKRPFFIGPARDTWNECAAKFAARQMPGTDGTNTNVNTQLTSFWQKNKTPILIGGGILAALIIYQTTKK